MTTTFRDLIADNKRKSLLLVVLFILFTAAVAMVLSLAVMFYFDQNAVLSVNLTRSFIVGGIAMGISVLLSIGSYY